MTRLRMIVAFLDRGRNRDRGKSEFDGMFLIEGPYEIKGMF